MFKYLKNNALHQIEYSRMAHGNRRQTTDPIHMISNQYVPKCQRAKQRTFMYI